MTPKFMRLALSIEFEIQMCAVWFALGEFCFVNIFFQLFLFILRSDKYKAILKYFALEAKYCVIGGIFWFLLLGRLNI